jgi:hypothetical protein
MLIDSMSDEELASEAIKRAEAHGLYRAIEQRPVDWSRVREWAKRCQQPGFQWDPNKSPVVSRNGAVCDGQHRILGGLMGGNIPPYQRYGFDNKTQPWDNDTPIDVSDYLI